MPATPINSIVNATNASSIEKPDRSTFCLFLPDPAIEFVSRTGVDPPMSELDLAHGRDVKGAVIVGGPGFEEEGAARLPCG